MKRKLWMTLAALVLLVVLRFGSAAAVDYVFNMSPTSYFYGNDRIFVVSWQTSFVPVKVDIIKHSNYTTPKMQTVRTITEQNELGQIMHVAVPMQFNYSSDYYYVRAYYGTGSSECKLSPNFKMSWDDVEFTVEPACTFNGDDRTYTISWETSFVPQKVEIQKYSNYSPHVETFRTITDAAELKKAMSAVIPAHRECYQDYYLVKAYYGDNSLDCINARFASGSDSIKFTRQAKSEFFEYYKDFRLSWETSFVPVKVCILKDYETIKTITEPDKLRKFMYEFIPMPAKEYSTAYRIKAFYGDGDWDFILSDSFMNDWDHVKFCKEPAVTLNQKGDRYLVSWETTYSHEKAEVWKHTSDGASVLETVTDPSMSCELPLSKDAEGDYYYIASYYNANNDIFSGNFIKNDAMLQFTRQPAGGVVVPDGTCRVSWTTSYLPVRVEIGSISPSNGQFERKELITTGLNRSMGYDFHHPDGCENLVIRAYYSDTDYKQSAPFDVIRSTDYAFVSVPVVYTALEPNDIKVLEWETSFKPYDVQVISFNEDGTQSIIAKDFMSSEIAKSMKYCLPWDRAGQGAGRVVIRAYISGSSYVDATCAVNRKPLFFATQPEGGIARPTTGKHHVGWFTNFNPQYVVIERRDGSLWNTVETLYDARLIMGYDIPVDLNSEEESFTFRVRAVYNGPSYFDAVSDEFVIENPMPVTLTLTYPDAETTDRVYTLRKTQKASEAVSELPTAPTAAYTINGWYADRDYTELFDPEQQIMEDTVAYCSTTPRSYTVTFRTNGGNSIDPVVLPYGSLVTVDKPVQDECLFLGWYTDAALTKPFILSRDRIRGDTILYARWKPDGIAVDETNFPLVDFRNLVTSHFDTDGNGYLTRSEIDGAESINIIAGYDNIQGVEYLTGLTTLSIQGNRLTQVNLTNNPKLTSLVLNGSKQLKSVDLSTNTALETVDMSGTGLTGMDATVLTKMYKLDLHGCESLAGIGVKGTKLRILDLHDTGIPFVDISACSNLWMAYLYGTQTDYGTYTEYYHAGNNARLKVDKCTTVYRPADTVEISKTRFPDEMFRAYVSDRFDTDHNGRLNPEEISRTNTISIYGSTLNSYAPVTTLKGIEYLTELTSLSVGNVGLKQVDLRGNTKLTTVYLEKNELRSLDVSMLPGLTILNVYENPELTDLTLGTAPNLQQVMCYGTAITALDFSGAPRLATAYLDAEPAVVHNLNEYDGDVKAYFWAPPDFDESREVRLYTDPAMTDVILPPGTRVDAVNFPDEAFRGYVSAQADKDGDGWLSPDEMAGIGTLTIVDDYNLLDLEGIEYLTGLTNLTLRNVTGLTELNLLRNTELESLEIRGTHLHSLQLDGLNRLEKADISQNALTSLNAEGCALKTLNISSNPIRELNLGQQPALEQLDCTLTELFTLDIRSCPLLDDVYRNGTSEQGASGPVYSREQTGCILAVPGAAAVIDTTWVEINGENFPDENFREVLAFYCDNNHDGWLNKAERDDEITIAVDGVGAWGVTGLEFFPELENIAVSDGPELTAMDLSRNTALGNISVTDTGLASLRIEGLAGLQWLSLDRNALQEIDVSGFDLIQFTCNSNPLSRLILGAQNELAVLECYGTNLQTLDLRGCPRLSNAVLNGTRTEGDLLGFSYVQYMIGYDCWLRVDPDTEILLPGSIPVDAVHFPDERFRGYVSAYIDINRSGWLTKDEIRAVDEIILEDAAVCRDMTSLTGMEFFTELQSLIVGNAPQLTELTLSANRKISNLDLYGSGLTELDVSGLPLESFSIADSPLVSLTLGNQKDLWYLGCTGTNLEQLDLRGCPLQVRAYLFGEHESADTYEEYTYGTPVQIALKTDRGIRISFVETCALAGDMTDWEERLLAYDNVTGTYLYSTALNPFSRYSIRYEFDICLNGGEYTIPVPVYDAGTGMKLIPMGSADESGSIPDNAVLYTSDEGVWTFAFNPEDMTLTVTNDLKNPGTFLVLDDGVYNMYDSAAGRGIGEGEEEEPVSPYVFASGTTLRAAAYLREGENRFRILSDSQSFGADSIIPETAENQLSAGKTARMMLEEGQENRYDFYYNPESRKLVVRKRLYASSLSLCTWYEDENGEYGAALTEPWTSDSEEETVFTISPAAVRYAEGSPFTVTAPVIPGYRFSAWYSGYVCHEWDDSSGEWTDWMERYGDEPLSTEATVSFDILDVDSLVAFYTKADDAEVMIAFDTRGGSTVAPQILNSGETAAEPVAPMKIGAYFGGWFTEESCPEAARFDFTVPVVEDMTLFAKWIVPEPASVLRLPAMLETIEADAFCGVSAEAVIIPEAVTGIEGDPFAGSAVLYIYGYPGDELQPSAAKTFADQHPAYTFIPIDDNWLKQH